MMAGNTAIAFVETSLSKHSSHSHHIPVSLQSKASAARSRKCNHPGCEGSRGPFPPVSDPAVFWFSYTDTCIHTEPFTNNGRGEFFQLMAFAPATLSIYWFPFQYCVFPLTVSSLLITAILHSKKAHKSILNCIE